MRHESSVGKPHHHHSFGVGAVALDGLFDEIIQVPDIIYVGVEVVATGISGIPPPLQEPVHRTIGR
jgi:hypothetical protein